MWGIQGLVTMIQQITGIPMGAQIKRVSESGNSQEDWARKVLERNDFVASIVDITVDDVCLGQTPFYYASKKPIPEGIVSMLDRLNDQFNSVAKWVARDLLTKGASVYTLKVKEKGGVKIPLLFPVLGTLEYYLNYNKEVVVTKNGKRVNDTVVFLSYDKDSLCEVEGKSTYFQITPKPIQLAHVGEATQELLLVERSIQRYRRDASRVIQFANVDVGLSQGNSQNDAIDAIASPLNANSISLEMSTADMFEDSLPVIPNRRGIGKPDIEQHVPNINIQDMADLDHVLSKLFLAMKFPKSYADFQDALSSTAVSLIRGDIRYSRMIMSVQSLMVTTVNKAVNVVNDVRRNGIEWKMTAIPNPEDDEVVSALQQYSDFIDAAYTFIVTNSETAEEARRKVSMYESLLGDATSLKSIQMFFNVIKKQIDTMPKEKDTSVVEDEEDIDGLGDIPTDVDLNELAEQAAETEDIESQEIEE